jgi:hypothetical protein
MIEALPDYVNVERWETGKTFSLSAATYRRLCSSSLGIIQNTGSTMAIYRSQGGCALDIFSANRYLCLKIDSENNSLALFASNLDSVDTPCILETDLSSSGWRALTLAARAEILKQ